ncbi:MAG: bifunctional [glutamine synthetase] adenylyltransferase/[glutamine synthetase]-adenylyl-L-tyrosine phosphorylase [Mycobacteriaceae bacterium]
MSPPRSRSVVPGPGRLGLVEPPAADWLQELGWNTAEHAPLLWALARSADPDLTLRTCTRIAETAPQEWAELERQLRDDTTLRGRVFGVLGASEALGDHLVTSPSSWRTLIDQGPLPTPAELRAAMLAAVGGETRPGDAAGADRDTDPSTERSTVIGPAAVLALRQAYRDQLLVLAARDLAATVEGEPVLTYSDVAAHLSDLAGAALTAALAVAVTETCGDQPCPVRLAVVAMGKCGARELNYVSDVDVVFVAEPADAAAARLAAALMRIADAALFEMDAGLRPEGRSGPLVRTVDSHLAYYRRWAKTWEFQALLKARPLVGDLELGKEYLQAVSPMVWTASDREDFVGEVQAMRRRVEDSVPPELRERELKLGWGGLRDVEFAVQLLQLVHGRDDEDLHVAGTLDALAALGASGYIGRDDAANLTASYEFLRLLEHRLQLQKLRRTHLLPDPADAAAVRWLARAAHVRPDGLTDAAGVLGAELRRNSHRVRRLHEKLFYRPLLAAVAGSDSGTGRLSPDSAARTLSALGYVSPAAALGHLRALTNGVSRRYRVQTVLLPTLLDWLGDTPDPDGGLLAYRRVSDALVDASWFLRALRDEPSMAQRLMQVLGTSPYATELLIRSPDVLRRFGDTTDGPRLLQTDPAEVAHGVCSSAARHAEPERAVEVARSLRRHELARVASVDLLGLLDVQQVCLALSSIWAAVLDAAVTSVASSEDGPAPGRIAVIGMGRLGGAELGYGSDADVLFVCEPTATSREEAAPGPDEQDAVRWATAVAERARRLLAAASTDPPLEVDIGLRPEGRNGPMVRTLAAYAAYYQQWAQPWEVQALLRARPVAGDVGLGERFTAMADPIRYPDGGISDTAAREIRRIKARVDAERLPRGANPATHTKLGRGGLADVEWTAQLLQLRHAHAVPGLRTTSTVDALSAAGAAELVGAGDVEVLQQAWLTATRARNALVLVRGKAADQLPAPGRVLTAVAHAAGWPDAEPGAFLDHYLKVTRRARAVVERVFGSA